jgi:hypothetical protein
MGTYQCVCDDGYQQTGQKSHCEGKCVLLNSFGLMSLVIMDDNHYYFHV